MMITYLYVALGGALGAMARYAAAGTIARGVGEVFPWGTFLVNVSGCFVIGFFAALSGPGGRLHVSPDFRQFFMTGICGGYTTFSSFSLQTLVLARDGDMPRATANVVASVAFCMLGVWLGTRAGTALSPIEAR